MSNGNKMLGLEAKLKGGPETADGLDKIAKAEKQVGEQTKDAGKKATEAAEGQKRLGGSNEDLVAVLSRVSPALGGLVDGMLKGNKIIGQMANENINLKGALGKVTSGLKANAGALKFYAAAGAVVAGIMAIVTAMRKRRRKRPRRSKSRRPR